MILVLFTLKLFEYQEVQNAQKFELEHINAKPFQKFK